MLKKKKKKKGSEIKESPIQGYIHLTLQFGHNALWSKRYSAELTLHLVGGSFVHSHWHSKRG